MISFGAPMSVSALAITKAFSPVSASKGTLAISALSQLLDVDAAAVGQRHRRRPEPVSSVIEK